MHRMNCWEFMGCGREYGGRNALKAGICPAAIDQAAHGVNGGECAGRLCWSVSGTFCQGEPSPAAEHKDCESCEFFKTVEREEGISFQLRPEDHSLAW